MEFRLSVRSAADLAAADDTIALMLKATKPGTKETGSVAYMAADYLRSRNVVRELDRDGWLRSIFSRDQSDFLSRFDPAKSDDDLWLYWREMISANVDRISGLVLVRVLAFTPEDALALARAASDSTEKMIDSVSKRERRDALFSAEQELERASQRYSAALTGLRDVRNQEGTIDPEQTVKDSADILLGVMREKLSLERDYAANLTVMSANSPQQKVLSDQIRALGSQVASLTEALTSRRKDAKTAAQSIEQFEKQQLEVQFSKRLLEIAQASYERARQEAERQHIYFALYVEPKKPQTAEYPRRARSVAFVGICAFSVWGVMMLALAGIKDTKTNIERLRGDRVGAANGNPDGDVIQYRRGHRFADRRLGHARQSGDDFEGRYPSRSGTSCRHRRFCGATVAGEQGLHNTGVCGFVVDERNCPGVTAAGHLEIKDADNHILIYRRCNDAQLVDQKLLRIETQLFRSQGLDDGLIARFQMSYKSLEAASRRNHKVDLRNSVHQLRFRIRPHFLAHVGAHGP